MIWGIFKKTKKRDMSDGKITAEKKVKEMMKADKITPEFVTKKEEDEYESIKRKVYGETAYRAEKKFNKQAERNLMGIELEKVGKIDEAIKLYEKNVQENSPIPHPYMRLAIIYKKKGQQDEEIRVLEKAVLVFKKSEIKEKFKIRLGKIYNKLAIYFHENEQFDDEVRMLERATSICKNDDYFKRRLEKAKSFKEGG